MAYNVSHAGPMDSSDETYSHSYLPSRYVSIYHLSGTDPGISGGDDVWTSRKIGRCLWAAVGPSGVQEPRS
jgi:hypothetical protein